MDLGLNIYSATNPLCDLYQVTSPLRANAFICTIDPYLLELPPSFPRVLVYLGHVN